MAKRALEGLDGVSGADVSFARREAQVRFDPARVTVERMIAALERVGYRAAVKGVAQR